MAWLFVVKGACLTLATGVDVARAQGYAALTVLAEDYNLVLKTSTDDDGRTYVFIGKEMHPSRHIYQGAPQVLDDTPLTDDLMHRLWEALNNLWVELGVAGLIEQGVILNQFD